MSYSVTRRNGSLWSCPRGGSIDVNKAMISPVTSCLNYWVLKVPLFVRYCELKSKLKAHMVKGNLVMLPLCPSIMAAIDLWRISPASSSSSPVPWSNVYVNNMNGLWMMVHNKLCRWRRRKSCVTFWTTHFLRLVSTGFVDCRCR